MTDIENKETSENSNITRDELIELKKQLATEVVDKLLEKDPNLASSLPKKSMADYLVDENTIKDILHDEILLGGLGELIGLKIAPSLKKYREMFSKVNTKNELENSRTTILDEISWIKQSSTTSQESHNEQEESNESTGMTEEKKQQNGEEEQQNISSDKKDSTKEEKNQEGVDKEKNTYTNSKSGLTYCMYDQNDPRRGNKKKNGGTTMNQTGCLLTSAAVIHSAMDPSITPDYYRQHYAGRFPYKSIPEASQHKFESKKLTIGSDTTEEMINHLKKGYPINFMVRGKNRGGKNTLTSSQHYMSAVDIRENNGKEEIFIANTHNGKGGGRVSADKAFVSLKEASLYTPSQA